MALQKQYIKNQIESVYNYIEYKKIESLNRLKDRLKSRVYTGYELATRIYNEKKGLIPDKQLQKEILETLRKVRYGEDGYYFIAHLKSDTEIITKMLPATPNAEEVNAYGLKDEDNNYYVQHFAKIVTENENHEGFYRYKWFKLTKKIQFKKISFVKLFEPYNWFIGYGEYFDDFEKSIKEEALHRLNLYRYGDNGYIFTSDINKVLLQHPYRPESIGKDDSNTTDSQGRKLISIFIQKALGKKEGDYVEYFWNKPNENNPTKKIGYVKHIPDWDWVIGTGVYTEDIRVSVDKIKREKEEELTKTILNLLVISIIMLISCIVISLLISRRVNRIFYSYQKSIKEKQSELEAINDSLEDKVREKTKELKILNEQLEHKIEQRLLEIKEKDSKLLEQSKMVALGEMIGNIAHQWRQPLSAITTAASGIKIKKELEMLDDKELIEFTDGIMYNSKYLSQVIDDFKNYIKDEKTKVNFDINEAIRKSLSIVDSSLHNHKLNIITSLEEDLIINNYLNELVQAIVNILNNAKDALKDQIEIEDDRLIFINSYRKNNQVIISIKDSAGGIGKDILPKIFEPYFTTKEKTQGTGLGLYMTYKIVVDSMKGHISAENVIFRYKGKNYKGCEFKITLDLN